MGVKRRPDTRGSRPEKGLRRWPGRYGLHESRERMHVRDVESDNRCTLPAIKDNDRNSNQVVGNVGLFYVCYRLSRLGWNVMPTARNARGIDILIYSQDFKRTRTVQVKALSRPSPVPLGTKLDGLLGNFFIICRNVALEKPECFVLTPAEVRKLAHRGEKDAKISYWLQPKHYATAQFREKWERIH